MLEVRIHGRGGQGVVTAAEVLALAAFDDGRHSHVLRGLGPQRTAAPVVSFVRISDDPIRVREPVVAPGLVIVLDATLLHEVDVFAGLRPNGWVLVDSGRTPEELGLGEPAAIRAGRCLTVPATELAMTHVGQPIPIATLVGAFAGLTGLASLRSVQQAVEERFPGALATATVAAAVEGFHDVQTRSGRATSAAGA